MDRRRCHSLFQASCLLTAFPLALALCASSRLFAGDGEPDSGSLVQQALRAELDGDSEKREMYLTSAIRQNPNDSAARSMSGFLKQDDRWMPVQRSASLNASNDVLSQYSFLRDRYAGTLAGEIALARWCRINEMEDREQLHWRNVIASDPNHDEARKRLKLREFRGQLMTKEEVDAYKQSLIDDKRALRKWEPTLNRLRRELESTPSAQESDAWKHLAAIDDPEAVAAMEKLVRRVDTNLQIHLVDTIGSIQAQDSADALVRLSLNLSDTDAREAAARKLAEHPVHAYAPQYLDQLESPIQAVSSLNAIGYTVISHTRLRQERPDDAINLFQSTNAGLTVQDPRFRATPAYRQIVAREVSLHRRKIAETERAVAQKNAQTEQLNGRIFNALRIATGEEMGDVPSLWWDWWKHYNEYLVPDYKREYYFTNTDYRRRTIRAPQARRCECFPAGTLVHTETGKRPIEGIRPGDKVLSQDLTTGELSYRLVLQTSIRPPSDTMQIAVGGELITATVGHPFWVVGRGWTMAKELNPGDRLREIHRSTPIDVTEGGVDSEAYNLMVDQTHSYFVGDAGFLVHDNIIREASRSPLPGWNPNDEI
ncbi:polymorphic toxin-type HINT domain-containing protein [Planctomycetes bacterium TBK1r]|uniref:Hint domain-containing protein n=1 Tax=Stieleria magnilauensis TaxID=2527963 RepID=A0ABX5XZ12_9BACT|nr:hypothetical protein TBK1r_51880 [Planctomycetes bacterium TBK1r]